MPPCPAGQATLDSHGGMGDPASRERYAVMTGLACEPFQAGKRLHVCLAGHGIQHGLANVPFLHCQQVRQRGLLANEQLHMLDDLAAGDAAAQKVASSRKPLVILHESDVALASNLV